MVKLVYYFNDNMLIYVSFVIGYKVGGMNIDRILFLFSLFFDVEKLWSVEIGIKYDFEEYGVCVNVVVYYI